MTGVIDTKAQPPVLFKKQKRKEASARLAVALQTRYRRLLEASGEDEIVVATSDLAQAMYENIEFIVWALKSMGGMNPPPPHELRKITSLPRFEIPPKVEEILSAEVVDDECACPPLEAGIIGRERHMTSCPKFAP